MGDSMIHTAEGRRTDPPESSSRGAAASYILQAGPIAVGITVQPAGLVLEEPLDAREPRWVLYRPSTKSKLTPRASTGVPSDTRSSSSYWRVAKRLSHRGPPTPRVEHDGHVE